MKTEPISHRLYHSSTRRGLTRIDPRMSTHGQAWVYAARTEVIAMMFLTRADDFVCATGEDDKGNSFIIERFEGAFGHAYGGVAGALYTLPGDTFVTGLTDWSGDLVSYEAVVPISETPISDAQAVLMQYVAEGRLILKRYPERYGLPEDDEDLVRKAIEFGAVAEIERYHSHLLDRVHKALRSKT